MMDFETRELKCTACGAPLHCEPGATVAKCAHCGTEFVVDELATEGPVESVPAEAETEKRGSSKNLWIIIVVAILAATAVDCILCIACWVAIAFLEL